VYRQNVVVHEEAVAVGELSQCVAPSDQVGDPLEESLPDVGRCGGELLSLSSGLRSAVRR
jgi:hypothetical protein